MVRLLELVARTWPQKRKQMSYRSRCIVRSGRSNCICAGDWRHLYDILPVLVVAITLTPAVFLAFVVALVKVPCLRVSASPEN